MQIKEKYTFFAGNDDAKEAFLTYKWWNKELFLVEKFDIPCICFRKVFPLPYWIFFPFETIYCRYDYSDPLMVYLGYHSWWFVKVIFYDFNSID